MKIVQLNIDDLFQTDSIHNGLIWKCISLINNSSVGNTTRKKNLLLEPFQYLILNNLKLHIRTKFVWQIMCNYGNNNHKRKSTY